MGQKGEQIECGPSGEVYIVWRPAQTIYRYAVGSNDWQIVPKQVTRISAGYYGLYFVAQSNVYYSSSVTSLPIQDYVKCETDRQLTILDSQTAKLKNLGIQFTKNMKTDVSNIENCEVDEVKGFVEQV